MRKPRRLKASERIRRAMRANEREAIRRVRKEPNGWRPGGIWSHGLWKAFERLEKAGILKWRGPWARKSGYYWVSPAGAARVMRSR